MRRFRPALLCLLGAIGLIGAACAPTTPPTGLAPVAVLTATPESGTAPLEVEFSSAGSSDPDGTITGYSWDFGDGTPVGDHTGRDPHLRHRRHLHRDVDGHGQHEQDQDGDGRHRRGRCQPAAGRGARCDTDQWSHTADRGVHRFRLDRRRRHRRRPTAGTSVTAPRPPMPTPRTSTPLRAPGRSR